MNTEQNINYQRIATAIEYLGVHFKEQPSLGAVARQVHLSPFHFQRLFTEWAGVSPKKFMQYLSVEYAKQLLRDKQVTLFDAAHLTGLSGSSRLHDLFINIEGMTPGDCKNGGENLEIEYHFAESRFGKLLIATTPKGICHLAFYEDKETARTTLVERFPNANYLETLNPIHENGLSVFQQDWNQLSSIRLHLQGTAFQIKVWEALLKIPMGGLSTYGTLAEKIGKPSAARAVGTAIGSNPVAFLIPCHRVIQATGKIGGYMWGNTRKSAIIGWEASKTELEHFDHQK